MKKRRYKRRKRGKTSVSNDLELSWDEMYEGFLTMDEHPYAGYGKPKKRSDCANVPRPCPYVSCRYNTYVDVSENGTLWMNFPDREPHEMGSMSCALDIAEREGNATLSELATDLGKVKSREGARLLVRQALEKIGEHKKALDMSMTKEELAPWRNWGRSSRKKKVK